MGHQEDRDALMVQFLEYGKHIDRRFAVQVPGGFISQDDGRIVYQGSRDRYALLFTPGKLVRIMIHSIGKANTIKCFYGPSANIPVMVVAIIKKRELDIFQGSGPGQ
ncbi:hypothetical protein ES703_95891 [subsurface metagenome]